MTVQPSATEFFTAGGTLAREASSYVPRPADEELFQRVISGEFCYVLTARQRGKSSLMIRTAARLQQQGIQVATVDLSRSGTQLSEIQWYLSILHRLVADLQLPVVPETWWETRAGLSPVQRFTDFLQDVVLTAIPGRVVIFVDEIDSTLKLGFTDDFFAAIRVAYNQRATNPAWYRLIFVLLGVAMPADLVKDRRRTPFNIGVAIDLQDLSRADAQPLEEGLERLYPGLGSSILDRIFFWTHGHPYLTQRLCLAIAESAASSWSDDQIDTLVRRLFLAEEMGKDSNIQVVRESVSASREIRPLLQLYRRIYAGQAVPVNEQSSIQNSLRLIGLVRAEKGNLVVSNAIYRQIFDQSWIRATIPANRTAWIMTISLVVIVVSIIAIVSLLRQNNEQNRIGDINNLERLCRVGADYEAQRQFFMRSEQDQLALFQPVSDPIIAKRQGSVALCLVPKVLNSANTPHRTALLKEMCCAMVRAESEEDETGSRATCDCRPSH